MEKLNILGTGYAMSTKCYNTCFTLSDKEKHFLVDAGGGNGILVNLEKMKIKVEDIKAMFISHTHSDHILGAPWIIRAVCTLIAKGKYSENFIVYGEESVLEALKVICNIVLKQKFLDMFGDRIILKKVKDGEKVEILGKEITFFD